MNSQNPIFDTRRPVPRPVPVVKNKVQSQQPPAQLFVPKVKLPAKTSAENVEGPVVLPPLPPSKGMPEICDTTGRKYYSNRDTLVSSLWDLSEKTRGLVLIAFLITINKRDAAEFLEKYSFNRKISDSYRRELTTRMNEGQWLINWTNLSIDSAGEPCNGGHTLTAFLESKLTTITLGVTLGVDPSMRPFQDTGKPRDLTDQACYLHGPVYDGIPEQEDRRQMVYATSLIFHLLNLHHVCDLKHRVADAKKLVCKTLKGQNLLYACNPLFIRCRDMLRKRQAESPTSVSLFNGLYYVPALLLYLNGQEEIAERFTFGDMMRVTDNVFKAHNFMTTNLVQRRGEGADRREFTEVLFDIRVVLSYLYAKITQTPHVEIFKRPKAHDEGDMYRTPSAIITEDKWKNAPKQQLAKNPAQIRKVEALFLESIKI